MHYFPKIAAFLFFLLRISWYLLNAAFAGSLVYLLAIKQETIDIHNANIIVIGATVGFPYALTVFGLSRIHVYFWKRRMIKKGEGPTESKVWTILLFLTGAHFTGSALWADLLHYSPERLLNQFLVSHLRVDLSIIIHFRVLGFCRSPIDGARLAPIRGDWRRIPFGY